MSTLDLGKIKQLWRGTWNTSSTYLPNDIVAYNSGVWICTQSHAAGVSTEFSPGKRDRANALTKTVDPAEVITFAVTVQTVNNVNYFFIDGRQTPSLTLYPNVRYRFYQKDASNINHRFALSTTPDGIFNAGVEYSAGTYIYSGTAGIDGALDVILPSTATTLYFYSASDINYGNATATVKPAITTIMAWRGWQYWDQVTSGFSFKGAWSGATQFFYNDIVEYQGATYLALADSLNKQPSTPTNSHFWLLMVSGDRRSEHNSVGIFMNKGPIDWQYPHGNYGNGNHLDSIKWISRSGRVYTHGAGYNNTGLHYTDTSVNSGFPQEVVFNHADWWASRDNGGSGRMTTPDGMPPKCIQIEAGYSWAYFLFNNGELWSVGSVGGGGLGIGETVAYYTPRRVSGLNDVKILKISTPYGPISDNRHVMALDDQGFVWTWGKNGAGQCGLGHTTDMYTPQRLPRSYFNNERIIDILAQGPDSTNTTVGTCYVRTQQDNLYAWGYNGAGQLAQGITDTTNRYRPVLMTGWVPSANNGIKKWQVCNVGVNGSFMILDGNGFMWHVGADPVGHAGFAAAATRYALTKSTVAPGGSIADFFVVWSGDTAAYQATFIRHTNGFTYVCGQGSNSNNVQGTTGATASIVGPIQLPALLGAGIGITNLREVYMHVSATATLYRTVHFLTDAGKVFAQGYNNYGEFGTASAATGATTNAVDESGSTNYPSTVFLPPTARVRQLLPSGSGGTSVTDAHGMFYLLDNGQVMASGQSRNTSSGISGRYYTGQFIGYSPNAAEGTAQSIPVSIQYAR